MTKLLDKICKIRDLLTAKDYGKLRFYNMEILKLKEEIHRHIAKKTKDYKHELDFTYNDEFGYHVIDVKGVITPIFKLKKKLVEALYNIEIEIKR